jgi:methionyl-tRNA formyltransferase
VRQAIADDAGEAADRPNVARRPVAVACGEGAVRILELQRAGRQAMQAEEFLRGSSVAPGTVFG